MEIRSRNVELDKDCARLANASYNFDKPEAKDVVAGYKRNKVYDTNNEYSGFQGCVFEKGNTVVIAYRGTDNADSVSIFNAHTKYKNKKKSFMERRRGDDGSDAALTFDELPAQYEDAENLYNKVVNDPKYKDKKILLTGHSLGGALAQLVASKSDDSSNKPNVEAVTFNAYGRKKFLSKPDDNFFDFGNTYNYYIRGDKVGKEYDQPGAAILLPVSFPKSSPDYTRIASMSELRNRNSDYYSYHSITHFTNACDNVWNASANPDKQKAYTKLAKIPPKNFLGLF